MCLGGHFLRSFTEVGRPTLNVGDSIRADWGLGVNEREKNELSFSFSFLAALAPLLPPGPWCAVAWRLSQKEPTCLFGHRYSVRNFVTEMGK